jgi:hypothetical protein
LGFGECGDGGGSVLFGELGEEEELRNGVSADKDECAVVDGGGDVAVS